MAVLKANGKAKLDELIDAIEDIHLIATAFRENGQPWVDLPDSKDSYLEKCKTARKVLTAYLKDAPSLRGYFATLDGFETRLKNL